MAPSYTNGHANGHPDKKTADVSGSYGIRKSDMLPVRVDAQVFLRIAKHAKQTFPNVASGSLLGLDSDDSVNSVHISNCFAYNKKAYVDQDEKETKRDQDSFTEYQVGVLRALAEVRMDANAVGWYESTHHGNFLNEGFIESQYQFQRVVPEAVAIVYNGQQNQGASGNAKFGGFGGFQAFRLTAMAMKLRTDMANDDDPFQGFPSEKLLEEVEIESHMSPYVETLLLQMRTHEFNVFELGLLKPNLERNTTLLLDSLDEFSMHQRELQMYERQTRAMKEKAAKTNRAPKSVDTLTLTQQVKHHCRNLEQQISDGFAKLHLLSDDQGSKETRSIITGVQNAE